MSYLRYLCLFGRCPTNIMLCFCFDFLHLVYSMLPVSLDCPFLAHLAKGNVSFCQHLASIVR